MTVNICHSFRFTLFHMVGSQGVILACK